MTKEEILKKAKELYETDDVQIETDVATSEADDGVWVSAWVWVPIPDERLDYDEARADAGLI